MMDHRMLFCPVIVSVGGALPKILELLLVSLHCNQWNRMSMDFVAFGVIQLVRTPCAVELSVCMGFLGCGCPNSTSVLQMETANFACMNSTPNPALVAELITALMICEIS